MQVHVLTTSDNLEKLVNDINRALWDEDNEMSEYDISSLKAYLNQPDTVFITCYKPDSSNDGSRPEDFSGQLLGMASARFEHKPYDKNPWMYVDEVDVCVNQRRKGAGKLMMSVLIDMAEKAGCTELWLGTETDNDAAKALYQSLEPDEVEEFIGFNYELD